MVLNGRPHVCGSGGLVVPMVCLSGTTATSFGSPHVFLLVDVQLLQSFLRSHSCLQSLLDVLTSPFELLV
ncbi:unnamed protein product [Linum trigynum]|uniref:Uncharacterized protein n=1 Tax=Linum trigynum TaxID=586398 RepID=A0AAV2FJH1_9ROSI